jgi:signal transduction histidine kinase
MALVHTIAKRRFRRLFYVGVALLVVLTIGAFVVPSYVGIRSEMATKVDQLASSIIEQKRTYLEAVIVEKIGDIERIRERLTSQRPSLSNEEFDRLFREEVRGMIHATRLPDDGYVWINEILDYEGGDEYAIRFAHPNLVDTEGDYLSTNATDVVGNMPYQEELDGIRQNGEIFFDYYFKKMGSDEISHKLSFAKLYAPYDWVVATGVYLDDVDRLIETETAGMIASSNRMLRNGVLAIVVAIAVLLVMTVVFEMRIRFLIDSYVESERSISAQLLEEKSKLEETNRQKDRLFSIIAHDLRNPIQVLMSGIRLLDESGRQDADDIGRTIVDELKRNVRGVSLLLDQLLEWFRSQQETSSFCPRMVDLSVVVESVFEGVATMAQQKRLRLSNLCEKDFQVFSDKRMLETIIRNLVTNAIKFTREGGNVTVRSKKLDGAVEVSVSDTGVGIQKDAQARLFSIDSSYRMEGTNGETGSGLGLDVCNEFVQRHNGHLQVESRVNEGSTFSFTLPFPEAGTLLPEQE